MKKIINIIITILSVAYFSSCNYLDVEDYFDDTLAYDSIFVNYNNLHRYMWGIASYFPDEGGVIADGTPGIFASDEGFTTMSKSQFKGLEYVLGDISADNVASKGMSIWDDMYKIIRKTNIILERKHEANLTVVEDEEIKGYTHFMRGYAYYRLLMDYGPIILVGDKVYPSNEVPKEYNASRATYDECVEYICNEFETAAKYMPATVSSTFFGRPSRGAAFALIARLRLQHASPLFNGGQVAKSYYGGWKNKDGVNYISQTYDEKRWAIAAAAAKRVIDMGIYSLHTVAIDNTIAPKPLPTNVPSANFPDGAGGIDPLRSYSEMFNGETFPTKNPEFIWAKWSDEIKNYTKHAFPRNDVMGGWNALCVTQKVVDAYYMQDGYDKNNSSAEYPYRVSDNYDDTYFTTSAQKFSDYTLPIGVHAMYQNREMRFYASIGFSGRNWPARSCTESAFSNKNVFYHEGTFSGNDLYSGKNASTTNVNDHPSTGYVIAKWIHPDDAWWGNGKTVKNKPYPIIRYAEILLSYAEALNNLTGSYTIELPSKDGGSASAETYLVSRNTDEIKKYFDLVRFRVGLPGLTTNELSDIASIQNIIERERMVEFLFENKRYYDVRRWGIYEQAEKTGIYGMRLGLDKYSYYKTPIPVNHSNNRNRIIDSKLIFIPLPKSEVRRVEDLDQNPGWGN